MVVECGDVSSGDVIESAAVCKICVCGTDTVMMMRRGGREEGDAVPGTGDEDSGFVERNTFLCV